MVIPQRLIRHSIPTNRLLLGAQGGGKTAQEWAYDMNDISLPSTPIEGWPHVKFLLQYKEVGERLFEEGEFTSTPYFKNAWACIREYGRFTWCQNKFEILESARYFVNDSNLSRKTSNRKGTSPKNHPIIVRKVRDSEFYQACDGHHRAARGYVAGKKYLSGFINPWPRIHTPVQSLLLEKKGTGLEQEIPCPELSTWPRIEEYLYRNEFLEKELNNYFKIGINQEKNEQFSYCDIGCKYGFFLNKFKKKNFRIFGIEERRKDIEIAKAVFKIKESEIYQSNFGDLINDKFKKFDIVTCFGLVHEYAEKYREISLINFLKLLMNIAGHILIFDYLINDQKFNNDDLTNSIVYKINELVLNISNSNKHSIDHFIVGGKTKRLIFFRIVYC